MAKKERWVYETEQLLFSYWRDKNRIARLEAKAKAIVESIQVLEDEIENVKRVPGLSAYYGPTTNENVLKKDKDLSDVLAVREEQTDHLSDLLARKQRKLISTRVRIRNIVERITPIEQELARLTDEE